MNSTNSWNKGRSIIVLFFFSLVLNQTCKEPEKQMLVETGVVSNVKISSADVSGKILDLGEGISAYGHCYSTTANATTASSKTVIGVAPALGGFTSSLTGLLPNQTYYVKAYCSRGSVTVYGDEISFSTLSDAIPVVTTADVNSIEKYTAIGGGNVIDQGGTVVVARGICWDLAPAPTIDDLKTTDGSGTGSFTSSMSNLTANTKYYVRAYATNSGGTAYGNEVSFTTDPEAPVLPTATTSSANPVNVTSATLNGVVNANGQSTTVTFEYGLTNSYGSTATALQSPVTGNTNTDVSANITGLTGGTLYHFRVKAENGGGVTFGLDQTFTTLCAAPTAVTNTASDISNIGAKLKGTVTANGFSTTVTFEYGLTTGYGNTVPDIEGTVNGSTPASVSANLTGLQPNTTYHYRVSATSCGGTVTGGDQTFTTSCTLPSVATTAATNQSASAATLNGTVNANNFSSAVTFEYGLTTSYGTSVSASPGTVSGTGNTTVTASITGLTSNAVYHYRVNASNCGGAISGNDLTLTTLPVVTLSYYYSNPTNAVFQATIDAGGGAAVSERGICWSTSQNPTVNDNKNPVGSGTGTYSGAITPLTINTTYYIRAYAVNSSGTAYSLQYTMKTSAGTITDVDGNLYSTVTIGTQTWMRENLRTTKYNDNTSIPLVTDAAAWSALTTAGYCFYNNDASTYKTEYGALYNRYVNTAKLCPSGWHVSSLDEWLTLENYLGGTNVAGGRLKEIGTWHWISPNTDATNESGFYAYAGGNRTAAGVFQNLGTYACFWTTSNYSGSSGWYVYLRTSNGTAANAELSYKGGASVRCVKD